MSLSTQVQGRLAGYSDMQIRSLGKRVWEQYRVPKEDEMLTRLKPFFAENKITKKSNQKYIVAYCIAANQNHNRCSDELGGDNFIYDDGVKVHIVSTMSLRKIQAAFMKARNQARRRRGRRSR